MHKHCRNLGNTEATNLVHDCLHTERACMRICTRICSRMYGSVCGVKARAVGDEGKRKSDERSERRRGIGEEEIKRRREEEEGYKRCKE